MLYVTLVNAYMLYYKGITFLRPHPPLQSTLRRDCLDATISLSLLVDGTTARFAVIESLVNRKTHPTDAPVVKLHFVYIHASKHITQLCIIEYADVYSYSIMCFD